MISIVMTYYNRKPQLLKTLLSIRASSIKNIEVIIVDDCSSPENKLTDIVNDYPFPIHLLELKKEDKWYLNPCIPFNKGFKMTSGDIVVIQNPECYHAGDVLKVLSESVNDTNYITMGCYSLNEFDTKQFLINNYGYNLNNKCATYDGESSWYNHSRFMPRALHFCSGITKKNLDALGGFDERFATGVGYDDNEFLERIRRMGLMVGICDNPYVLHQFHYHDMNFVGPSNQNLYHQILSENTIQANTGVK